MKSLLVLSLALLVILTSSAGNLQTDSWRWHGKLNDKCKNWDKTRNRCIQCYQGCTTWENICVTIVKHYAKWDQQGNCVICQKGYGDPDYMSINGTCPQQQTNLTSIGNGNQTIDINCQCHNDNRQCVSCYAGYYLDFYNMCTVLPENCTAADPQGMCTACVAGYAVQNGTCVEQACDLTLCATFNTDRTACQTCPLRSYLQDGCCIQVNGYCSEWVETTGVCTECYVGYIINKNNDRECILNTTTSS